MPCQITLPNHVLFIIQVAEELSSPMILWEDLLKAERAKLAFMPELQGTDKQFLAELDEIEEVSWSMPTKGGSSLWPERSFRGSEKQPPARRKVVSSIRSNIFK